MKMDAIIMCYLMHELNLFVSSDGNVVVNIYWLVNRVECPILIDEVEAGCQLSILAIIVGWRVG